LLQNGLLIAFLQYLIWIDSPTIPALRLIDISLITRSLPCHPLLLEDNTFLSFFHSSLLLLGVDIAR